MHRSRAHRRKGRFRSARNRSQRCGSWPLPPPRPVTPMGAASSRTRAWAQILLLRRLQPLGRTNLDPVHEVSASNDLEVVLRLLPTLEFAVLEQVFEFLTNDPDVLARGQVEADHQDVS